MTGTLAERLAAVRRQAFVGRTDELRLFAAMLDGTEPATVLYVHGPGGVGKSTLLRQFGWAAEEVGRRVTRVDGRDQSHPDPGGRATTVDAGGVLLFDEVDALPGRRAEVLEQLLGGFPAGAVAVLAGREPPPSVWRTDPGWRSVVRAVRLGNLDDLAGRDLLRLRAVPAAAHDRALAFTHGHPLALALLADVVAGSDAEVADPATPEVLAVLLRSLVGTVPGPAHLAALEACSQVSVTTEPLLAALLGVPDARELFDWLRDLSVVDLSARGLYPHDVVRQALARELHWRHPDAHARFHGRARAYYERRLRGATDAAEGRQVLFDFAFLHRDSPVLGPFLRHVNPGHDDHGLTATGVRPGEWLALREVVAAHEGEESAALAELWARSQPGCVTVVRGPGEEIAGLVVAPALDRAGGAERAADPVAAAAWADLERRAPARDGETVLLVRHWMAAGEHQAVSAVQTFVTLHLVRIYLTAPALAQSYLCCADPDRWTDAMSYTDFARVPGADVDVGGRGYGLFGHDWRAVPPLAWMALLAGRERETDPLAVVVPETVRVLDEEEFAAAVRSALRDVARPDRLRDAALARSRTVVARAGADAGPAERGRAVRDAVLEAAAVLERSPHDRRAYRALHHTYLQPAPTQAAAADLLNLPTSTYRRHLATGIARITELLWQEELGG